MLFRLADQTFIVFFLIDTLVIIRLLSILKILRKIIVKDYCIHTDAID